MQRFPDFFSPSSLILVAALIGAVGVYWADLRKNAADEQLRKKSEEIAKLNERIAGLVTGGDSFCYFRIMRLGPNPDQVRVTAVQHGEYPIYEVHARVVDLQKFEQKKNHITADNFLADDINIPVGTMPAGTATMLPNSFPLGEGDKRDFNIFFSARNGLYTQLLRMRKIKGEWRTAIRVQMREGNDEKPVFEEIDKEFPPDEVAWKKSQ